MQPKLNLEDIREKTEELCQLIIDQSSFSELKSKINDFFYNEEAKSLYNDVIEKQRVLLEKQQQGLQITDDEMREFDAARETVYANPVSRDFLYATQEIDQAQDLVIKYVLKTVELERIPTEAELFENGGCGCGGGGACSCGGH